jgi:hypothetical protein
MVVILALSAAEGEGSLYFVVAVAFAIAFVYVFAVVFTSPITPEVEAFVQKSGCLIYGAIML